MFGFGHIRGSQRCHSGRNGKQSPLRKCFQNIENRTIPAVPVRGWHGAGMIRQLAYAMQFLELVAHYVPGAIREFPAYLDLINSLGAIRQIGNLFGQSAFSRDRLLLLRLRHLLLDGTA